MIAPAPDRPVSRFATASLVPAWAGIAAVVAGLWTDGSPFLASGLGLGAAGMAVAVLALILVGRNPARPRGRLRAFRALLLSVTAVGMAAFGLPERLGAEEARRRSEAAERLFHEVERRIEKAGSVSVRGRCDSFDQTLHFMILVEEPNRVLVSLSQTARDGSRFTKDLVCDGGRFEFLENDRPVHQGPAPPELAAHVKKALTRMQFEEGPFLGRGNVPFQSPVIADRELKFQARGRDLYPVSGFRFITPPEPAPFPNGEIGFVLSAGPERRHETLAIDRNSGLPWKRESEYLVGPAGWSRRTRYDEFVLDRPLRKDRFELRWGSR